MTKAFFRLAKSQGQTAPPRAPLQAVPGHPDGVDRLLELYHQRYSPARSIAGPYYMAPLEGSDLVAI